MGSSFLRSEARSILSRYRVELPALRVDVFESVIRIQGVLRRAQGLPELTHEALECLERELRRIPRVRRVEMLVSNWRRQSCGWTAVVPAAASRG